MTVDPTSTVVQISLSDEEISKIPLMSQHRSTYLQNTIIAKLVTTISETPGAQSRYHRIVNSMNLTKTKKLALETRYLIFSDGNCPFYDVYRALIEAIIEENGPSSNVGLILTAMDQAHWKSGRDEILSLPWHEIPDWEETKLPVDSATTKTLSIIGDVRRKTSWGLIKNEIVPHSNERTAKLNRISMGNSICKTDVTGPSRSSNGKRYGPLPGEEFDKSDSRGNCESYTLCGIKLPFIHLVICCVVLFFMVITLCPVTIWAIVFRPTGRQIICPQNLDIESISQTYITTTEMTRSPCEENPSIRLDDTYSTINATELLPNWKTPVLDLCHDSETTLIITEPLVLNDAQEIRCPERVTGLIIFVALTDIELQAYLNKFCQITKISFVGDAVCRLPNDTGIRGEKVSAKNLQAISFEDLENCEEFYGRLGDSLVARRLTSVAFKCTSFRKEELRGLEYFFRRQEIPRRVKCSNENGCVDLDLSVNRQAIVEYHVVSCI